MKDKILVERENEELREAILSLLEMPSACTRDNEIVENNKRRARARALISRKS